MSTADIIRHRDLCQASIRKLWPARSKPAKRELIRVCVQALRAINKSL